MRGKVEILRKSKKFSEKKEFFRGKVNILRGKRKIIHTVLNCATLSALISPHLPHPPDIHLM